MNDPSDPSPSLVSYTGLSVVIPAYNEENGITPVLQDLHRILTSAPIPVPFEILVVDDGSTDGTAAAVSQVSGVSVVRHERNRGYGAALKTGIRRARYSLICIIDADGTYPADRIPELVQRVHDEGLDMVVGARTGDDVHIPLVRRPAKKVLNWLANYIADTRIPDLNSGLRLFSRETSMQFFDILPDGFSFTTTITLAMLQGGFRVAYVPINYHHRVGSSKIRPLHAVVNFTQLVLRLGLYFAPMKIFAPLGWGLIGTSVGWGLVSRIATGRLADVSTLVIMMTGIQVLVMGLLAELINRRVPNAYRVTES